MFNNKAGIIGLLLGISLIAVSLFAYSQVSALQSNVSTMQTDNDNLQQQATDLQRQLNAKTTDLANAQHQITSLNAEIADQRETIVMHEQLLSQIESENHNLALAHYLPTAEPQPL